MPRDFSEGGFRAAFLVFGPLDVTRGAGPSDGRRGASARGTPKVRPGTPSLSCGDRIGKARGRFCPFLPRRVLSDPALPTRASWSAIQDDCSSSFASLSCIGRLAALCAASARRRRGSCRRAGRRCSSPLAPIVKRVGSGCRERLRRPDRAALPQPVDGRVLPPLLRRRRPERAAGPLADARSARASSSTRRASSSPTTTSSRT